MCGIYIITNNIDGKCYVGQSVNIEQRWAGHRKRIRSGQTPLYRAIRKYGLENFSFQVLEECEQEKLDEREIYYIDKYKSYYEGYNLTTGGKDGNSNAIISISKESLQEIYDLLQNSTITQNEIAEMYNVNYTTISNINTGKTRINPKLIYPLRKNKQEHKCVDCGKTIQFGSTRCVECAHKLQYKTEHPSREELKKLIRNKSFTEIGRIFGVSDNAVRHWCDKEHLPKRVADIKKISDKEWELI